MTESHILNFYLPPWMRDQIAQRGTIFGKIAQAALMADWRLRLRDESEVVDGPGFHLVYNRPVTHPLCLTLRRCYFEPFYRIEATNDRWDWEVARQTYTPGTGGDWFRRYWQNKLFKDRDISEKGYIFMPLQGRLNVHRHFQSMTPLAMIKAAIKANPDRQILASLHPREAYSSGEMQALQAIKGRFSVVQTPSLDLLAGCDFVVTQNSSMALIGMFAQKPCVLFGNIDFHHIAASVSELGTKAAFAAPMQARPWGNYLHWFFKNHAISNHDEEVISRLHDRFRAHGWPM